MRRNSRPTILIAAAAITLVMAGACGGGDSDVRAPSTVAAARADSTTPQADSAGGEVVSDTSNVVPGRWLSDANALALFNVMNSAQLAAANVELQAWRSDTVRAFAASVAQNHAALQHTADSLGASLGIGPVAPALSQEVSATMQAQIDSIRGFRGGDLDRAFLAQQAQGQGLMSDYTGQLSGVAQHPELQAFLASVSGRVGSEATAARGLQRAFVAADSVAAASAADSAAKRAARRKH